MKNIISILMLLALSSCSINFYVYRDENKTAPKESQQPNFGFSVPYDNTPYSYQWPSLHSYGNGIDTVFGGTIPSIYIDSESVYSAPLDTIQISVDTPQILTPNINLLYNSSDRNYTNTGQLYNGKDTLINEALNKLDNH